MCLDDQIAQVKAGMQFIKYREEGIASAEVTARELAEELELDRSYPEPRRRKKTRLFSYEAVDESDHQTGEEVFLGDFFYPLMDTAYASLQERFRELEAFKSTYGFLCGVKCMKEAQDFKNAGSTLEKVTSTPALPVTVASCERSFSKLKLTKTYQRSTMAQERLVGLSVISIEHEICRLVDTYELVD